MKTVYFKYFQNTFNRPFFFQTILLHYPLLPRSIFSPPRLYQSPQTFSSPCNRIFRLIAGDSSTNNRCPERERDKERQSFQEHVMQFQTSIPPRVCYRNTWPCRRSITRWGRSAPSRRELWRNLGDNWAPRNWRPSN